MRRLAVACCLLLAVPACGYDDGGAGDEAGGSDDTALEVADGDPVSPTAYARTVSDVCGDRLQAAEEIGYDKSSDEGADAVEALAEELAATTPPEDRRELAQAMVDGLAAYAELFRSRDDDPEEFSQNQNELLVIFSVRAAGLEADCGNNDFDLSEPAPPDETTGDPDVDADGQACFEGELAACDRLVNEDTDLKFYGVTCGGRLFHEEANENINCVDSFASDEPVRDQP
jgi:hypothetical protein